LNPSLFHPVEENMADFDVRCSASLGSPTVEQGRCQLFMGHDGAHAALFARDNKRCVRSWIGRRPVEFVDRCGGIEQWPWMRGLPMPAWAERQASSATV
jgi:hypothetical protein